VRGEQIAGVVVDQVDHPDALAAGERHLGGVDLPEIVGERALEPFLRRPAPRRLRRDQVIALQRLVDRRYRRRLDAAPSELGADPACTPTRMLPAQRADRLLEPGIDPPRRAQRPPRPRPQPVQPFGEKPPPVAVKARPRDPVPATDRRDRLTRPLRLEQHPQLELLHRHHPESHARLPHSHPNNKKGRLIARSAVSQICPERLRCVRNDLSQIYPVTTPGTVKRVRRMCDQSVTTRSFSLHARRFPRDMSECL
jgi:hypothetical protein